MNARGEVLLNRLYLQSLMLYADVVNVSLQCIGENEITDAYMS